MTPVALVLWRLRGLETLFTETTDDALRTLQGGALLRWAIAALLVTAGVQLAVALLHRAVPWPRWSAIAAGAAVLAIVGVIVFGGSGRYIQSHGGVSWVEDRLHALVTDADTEGGGNAAGRLTTMTTNGRIDLWREAARQSRYARVAGTGAGTFPFAHYRFRETRRRRQARAQPVVQRAQRAGRRRPRALRGGRAPLRGGDGGQPLRAPL